MTKSSTKAELVGASDYLPNSIWAQYFLGAERTSAGHCSCHINIQYFWIKDRLDQDLSIELRHCDTEAMLADFLAKPLQGTLFCRLWDLILGYAHLDSLQRPSEPTPLVERVGDQGFVWTRNPLRIGYPGLTSLNAKENGYDTVQHVGQPENSERS